MIYTFEFTDHELNRVTDYLDGLYSRGSQQYILGVQHRLYDDIIFVMVECSPESAVWIRLLTA